MGDNSEETKPSYSEYISTKEEILGVFSNVGEEIVEITEITKKVSESCQPFVSYTVGVLCKMDIVALEDDLVKLLDRGDKLPSSVELGTSDPLPERGETEVRITTLLYINENDKIHRPNKVHREVRQAILNFTNEIVDNGLIPKWLLAGMLKEIGKEINPRTVYVGKFAEEFKIEKPPIVSSHFKCEQCGKPAWRHPSPDGELTDGKTDTLRRVLCDGKIVDLKED